MFLRYISIFFMLITYVGFAFADTNSSNTNPTQQIEKPTQTNSSDKTDEIDKISKNKKQIIDPIQLTFVYPISIYGIQSFKHNVYVSISVLGGITNSVHTFEFATISNIDQHNVQYAQIAVISNVVLNNVKGVQIVGISNVVLNNVKGVQIAEISNVVLNDVKGIQIAGISNVVLNNVKGVQIAGISNVARHKIKGGQVAGIANYSSSLTGIQYAFVANTTMNSVIGTQFGLINYAGDVTGSQFGLINTSKHLNGFSLGLINFYKDINDSTVPIGLISIVTGKNGYHSMDIYTGVRSLGFNLKLGIPMFYTMYGIGYEDFSWKFKKSKAYIGIGSHFKYPNFKSFYSSVEFSYLRELDSNARRKATYFNLQLKGTLEYSLPAIKQLFPYVAITSTYHRHTKKLIWDAQLGLRYQF